MERNDTSDITDDIIDRDLTNANLLYTNILAYVYQHQSESTQRRSMGLVDFCCTPQQIAFLRELVRLFIENVRTDSPSIRRSYVFNKQSYQLS